MAKAQKPQNEKVNKDAQILVRVTSELKNKMKYVAWHDRLSDTDLLTDLLEKAITTFEKKHGPITDEQLKEARIK